jgi:TolB-like protein
MTNEAPRSGLGQLWAEIKRRHVVRFSLGYAAAAFVALQLAEIVFPAFGIAEGALRLLVVVVALGFLPAVVMAWLYDVTAHGIRRTEETPATGPMPRRLSVVAFALMAIGVTGAVTWYVLDQDLIQSLAAGRPAFDPTEPIRSLAVLPLDDFSAERDQEYFAAGMHEELIARLSMLEGVRVVSRTTVMRYAGTTLSVPEIGRELGVDVLLEGSVNRAGDRVRITLQVIHAASDSHITTLQFDREAGDVLSLQTEVAYAVAREIGRDEEAVTLAAADVTPESQDAYFRGRLEVERGTTEGYRSALEYFEAALEADSAFAPAMAGLAGARFLLGMDEPSAAAGELEQARAEATSALALDPASLEVREVLDLIERSMPTASTESGADEASPTTPVRTFTTTAEPSMVALNFVDFDSTWVAATTGLGQRMEEQVRRKSIDALQGDTSARQAFEARRLMASGRYAEAARAWEPVVGASPEVGPAWEMLARSYIGSGNPSAAVDAMRRWQRSGAPGAPSPESVDRLSDAVSSMGDRGYWTWKLEDFDAREGTDRAASRIEMAAAHAALGHDEQALDLLSDAVENGERGLFTLQSDPVWDDLRDDRRFRAVERQAQAMRFAPPPRVPSPPDPRGRGDGR